MSDLATCVCGEAAEYCSLTAMVRGCGIAVTCSVCRIRGAAGVNRERAAWEWLKLQRALKGHDAVVEALQTVQTWFTMPITSPRFALISQIQAALDTVK